MAGSVLTNAARAFETADAEKRQSRLGRGNERLIDEEVYRLYGIADEDRRALGHQGESLANLRDYLTDKFFKEHTQQAARLLVPALRQKQLWPLGLLTPLGLGHPLQGVAQLSGAQNSPGGGPPENLAGPDRSGGKFRARKNISLRRSPRLELTPGTILRIPSAEHTIMSLQK